MTYSSPRLQRVLGAVALVCALAVSIVVPAQAAGSSAPLSASTSTPGSSATAEPVTVSVQGDPVLGQTLSARAEAPSGSTYQWLRDGAVISGATSTSYRLVHADVCKRMSVRVSGKSCPANHPIKGNRPTDGTDWKYHVPSGAFYSRTTPQECFKTTSAAAAAGWRGGWPFR